MLRRKGRVEDGGVLYCSGERNSGAWMVSCGSEKSCIPVAVNKCIVWEKGIRESILFQFEIRCPR